MTTIRVVGVAELVHALERLAVQADEATRLATATAAHEVEAETKRLLGLTSHRKGTPTPSSPGEPPALVTGTLRRSIHVEGPIRVGVGTWQAGIGPTVVYGRIQELGGSCGKGHAARLPARPFMNPALRSLEPRLGEIYRTAWRRALG